MRYLLMLLLFPLCGLFGQPFPSALLLEAVKFAGPGIWHPDWPVELPPDSFTLISEDWVSISVRLGEDSFHLRRSGELITEFPWSFQGTLVQLRLDYFLKEDDESPLLSKIYLDDLDTIEILEYSWGYPSLLRILKGGVYYFVLMEQGTGFITESWFDREGFYLEHYEYSYRPNDGAERIRNFRSNSGRELGRRDFDSRFLITGINGQEGIFSINYSRGSLPAYWQRWPSGMERQNYSFQWDARDLLVRLSSSGESINDFRYEYTFDYRGNWIERREILMNPDTNLLIPFLGRTVTRVLEYGNNE